MNDTPTKPMRVGFIGLGDMGAPMAMRIARGGHELHTWARRPETLKKLTNVPFATHSTPAELASEVEHLGVCVGSAIDVRDVLISSGALAALPPESIVAVHATISPEETSELATHVRQLGHGYIDAPVSGARTGAEKGQLVVMAGATTEDLSRARPVMMTYSNSIFHVGDVGEGQRWKILNNLAMNINITAAHLVLSLGTRLGINRDELKNVMMLSSGSSRGLGALDTLIQPGAWHLANGEKDLSLARELLTKTHEDQLLSNLATIALEVRKQLAPSAGAEMSSAGD